MKIRVQYTKDESPHLYKNGIVAYITVSTPRNHHYLFQRLKNGKTVFVYGGEGAHARPSQSVINAAESATIMTNPRKKKTTRKKTGARKPSAKQLAARKKFAAMARARAKSAKRKKSAPRRKMVRKKTRRVKIISHNPRKLYIVSMVKGRNPKAYWEGRVWDTSKNAAKNFPTEASATAFAQKFANKYPTVRFAVETR